MFVTGNAGNAYDQGLELESQFVITPGLTGTFNVGLQDSRYTQLTSGAALASGFKVGGRLTQTPPFSLSGGLSWPTTGAPFTDRRRSQAISNTWLPIIQP